MFGHLLTLDWALGLYPPTAFIANSFNSGLCGARRPDTGT